jgi:hypothetical protein
MSPNRDYSYSYSSLGSTAQRGPWPPPQYPAEFLRGLSTIFLQGRFVSPTPNPHPGGPGLYLYPPEAGWPPILVASYDTHGLRWDCSYSPVTTRAQSWFYAHQNCIQSHSKNWTTFDSQESEMGILSSRIFWGVRGGCVDTVVLSLGGMWAISIICCTKPGLQA